MQNKLVSIDVKCYIQIDIKKHAYSCSVTYLYKIHFNAIFIAQEETKQKFVQKFLFSIILDTTMSFILVYKLEFK